MTKTLPDQQARQQALDVGSSCIVQAPAGSGKTELLTLRFLRLLAISQQPEEVLAITFTRKAASEMRDRIVHTLRWARAHFDADTSPDHDFELQRLQIAGEVLARDSERQWHLMENPSRLRVQTIDSFCFYLASQLPVLSHMGGHPTVSEDVSLCFTEAIQQTLALLESEDAIADDIERLLQQLDNDLNAVERLLSGLLPKRDQWLPYVLEMGNAPDQARAYLETGIDELITETLSELREALAGHETTLAELLNFSTENLISEGVLQDRDFQPITGLPAPSQSALSDWQLCLDLLLTKSGTWRKQVNKNSGFPTGDKTTKERKALCKQRKDQFKALSGTLQEQEDLLLLLNEACLLTGLGRDYAQWDFLSALLRVLSTLSAQLLIAFRKFRVVDYAQISTAALQALGESDNPTDLALALDHRIQHILVDEFQDTSRLQLQLLERLTDGWSEDDGRSLFLVGDAMQSCYGFRNANVGIYLDVQQRGINNLPLRPLRLSTNFRSRAPVIDWVNRIFRDAFPLRPDSSRGAVPYSASDAVREATDSAAVNTHIISYEKEQRKAALACEAKLLVREIRKLKQTCPDESIAILARGRKHFEPVIEALREADIAWQATDMDSLDSLMLIEDLLSLTRALLNPADQLAWLALLRAPWCGLTNAELLALFEAGGGAPVAEILQSAEAMASVPEATRQRLEDFSTVMRFALNMRYRRPLRQLVEATWTLLRGADCCDSEQARRSAACYFDLLEQHDNAGGLADLHEFAQQVQQAWVPSAPPAQDTRPVQLLTMHKAKGLEFDHVLIPGLALGPNRDDKALLQWHERLNRAGQSRLFLATLSKAGTDDDPLYSLLRHEQKQKALLESTRLLYIAVTRARHSATLFASLESQDGELKSPRTDSLLARIWEPLCSTGAWQETALSTQADTGQGASLPELPVPTAVHYLEHGIQLAETERELLARHDEALCDSEAVTADDSDIDVLASITGSLIHRALENHVRDPQLLQSRADSLRAYWTRQLQPFCDNPQSLSAALARIEEDLRRCLADRDNAWLFRNDLRDSVCELSLTGGSEFGVYNYVVDRTFIDARDRRWIIDYKSALPRPEQSEESFIAEQIAAHGAQLSGYRRLFQAMESRETVLALYFTALPRLVELPADAGEARQ